MELLGADVSVADEKMVRISPTKKRVSKLEAVLDAILDRRAASIGELDSLAGKLSF